MVTIDDERFLEAFMGHILVERHGYGKGCYRKGTREVLWATVRSFFTHSNINSVALS
jgi:hypothetical protein